MAELSLELDPIAQKSIKDLMIHYKVNNSAAIILKALSILKVAAHIEKTKGQLIARKGKEETTIIVR